jgi:eukaryotic-like serine/threonine-protein kinase
MSSLNADRNLLFGILALQNDFITRDALVGAFGSWVANKTRPIGEIFVERGDLRPSRRDMLESLVDEYIAEHGNDPAKSLAALSTATAAHQALASIKDPELQTSLAPLVARTSAPVPETLTYTGLNPDDAGRFRILRFHAKGGLGRVSVALDRELNREVAYKEIQEPHADEAQSRDRFLREGEVTGGLEHPGIVPVYSLGTQPKSGRPFYAMRFIRGENLEHAIEQFHANAATRETYPSVAFRDLLGRFLDVCDAVSYAHDRGVLHRDLKPGNIMLGKYGETLVVDWGLARVGAQSGDSTSKEPPLGISSDSSAHTVAGSAFGTPGFMSPEQAEGRLDLLGPATDVYSLGATLYPLLTGRAAFPDDDRDVRLEKTRRGEFARPREIAPGVPKALEAICLKAMALKPEDRYGSIKSLSEDVKQWLADEPVTAYRESRVERARRWSRKHRTLATTVAAMLLLGLIGSAAFGAVLTAKNRDLANQRRRAEDREQQAIDAVKRFRDAVADEPTLKNSPELEPLRKKLLKEPLAFFQNLREQLQADKDTRPEALERLAKAVFELASLTDVIGDKPDALRSYREVRAIMERLARQNPTVIAHQSDLAKSHNSIGNLLRETGKTAEALAAYEQACAIQERLARENPTVTEFQRDLAGSNNNIGVVLNSTGKSAEALAALEQARAIRERLARENPAVTEFQSDLAASNNNIGNLLSDTGKPAEALDAYERARVIQERLARENPAVAEFQSDLAATTQNIGILLSDTGQPAKAPAFYERARAILERLVREHPESPDYASSLGGVLNNLAQIDLDAGHLAEARDRLREAITWQKRALAANPQHPTYRQFLRNHFKLLLTAAQGLHDDALAAEAEQGLAELAASDPRLRALDARLAAVIGGEAPKDNTERIQLADRAHEKKLHAASARLFADALEADPTRADDRQAQHRYNAACAAALASAGKGEGEPPLDNEARAKLRTQALTYLRAELDVWTKLLESANDEQRAAIAQTLHHWQVDSDLATIRDAELLTKLHAEERKAFTQLWADVDALLKQAGNPAAAEDKP